MTKKMKLASLLSLLIFGLVLTPTPLAAGNSSVGDMINASQRNVWDPFAFLEEASSHFPSFGNFRSSTGINMYEEGSQLIVEASLPGIDVDDINLTYERGMIQIRADRKVDESQEDRNYYHRAMNTFAYNVEIPSNVDEAKAPVAEYENGLMKIIFEKSEHSKAKKIEIQKK